MKNNGKKTIDTIAVNKQIQEITDKLEDLEIDYKRRSLALHEDLSKLQERLNNTERTN